MTKEGNRITDLGIDRNPLCLTGRPVFQLDRKAVLQRSDHTHDRSRNSNSLKSIMFLGSSSSRLDRSFWVRC